MLLGNRNCPKGPQSRPDRSRVDYDLLTHSTRGRSAGRRLAGFLVDADLHVPEEERFVLADLLTDPIVETVPHDPLNTECGERER